MAAEHAYVLDVTTAGRVRWQVPGPPREPGLPQLPVLAVGAVAVLAQGIVLDGLRAADGHRVWSWAGNQVIAGMWRWHGLVVVLTQVSGSGGRPALIGLDASTGQARWTLRADGDVAGSYPTGDGGLAVISNGTLEVVDLSSGRVRWAGTPREYAMLTAPAMAVAGGALLVAVNGLLTSYDDQTGRVRWADTLLPRLQADGTGAPALQASAGLVYLSWWQGAQVLGISAADGRVEWRFAPGPQSVEAYAPGLVSVTDNSGRTWQDELDPAAGRVRWRAASSNPDTVTPAGTVTGPAGYEPGTSPAVGPNQVSLHGTLTGKTRWTSGLAGPPAQPAFPDGPLLIVPVAALDGSYLLTALRLSDGHRAWQVTLPEPAAAPLSAAAGGILIYTGNLVLPGLQPDPKPRAP
jgi:outer membrane protein assembly factor BamB